MDTQYTQGFKAGMAWREAEIIKLIEDRYLHRDLKGNPLDNPHNSDLRNAIALIKGEK